MATATQISSTSAKPTTVNTILSFLEHHLNRVEKTTLSIQLKTTKMYDSFFIFVVVVAGIYLNGMKTKTLRLFLHAQ